MSLTVPFSKHDIIQSQQGKIGVVTYCGRYVTHVYWDEHNGRMTYEDTCNVRSHKVIGHSPCVGAQYLKFAREHRVKNKNLLCRLLPFTCAS